MIDFRYDPIIGLQFWCISPIPQNEKNPDFFIPKRIWNESAYSQPNKLLIMNRKILKSNKNYNDEI
jgi:hypothetical protein